MPTSESKTMNAHETLTKLLRRADVFKKRRGRGARRGPIRTSRGDVVVRDKRVALQPAKDLRRVDPLHLRHDLLRTDIWQEARKDRRADKKHSPEPTGLAIRDLGSALAVLRRGVERYLARSRGPKDVDTCRCESAHPASAGAASVLGDKIAIVVALRRLLDIEDAGKLMLRPEVSLLAGALRLPIPAPPVKAAPSLFSSDDYKRLAELEGRVEPVVREGCRALMQWADLLGALGMVTTGRRRVVRSRRPEPAPRAMWSRGMAWPERPHIGQALPMLRNSFPKWLGTPPQGNAFTVDSIAPSHACAGDTVTIMGTGNVQNAFPMVFPSPLGVDNVFQPDDLEIENLLGGHWRVRLQLRGATVSGQARFGLLIPEGWGTTTYVNLPWAGSAPLFVSGVATVLGCNWAPERAEDIQNGSSLVFPADFTPEFLFDIGNDPSRVKIEIERAGEITTVFDREYQVLEPNQQADFVFNPLTNLVDATEIVNVRIFATNVCQPELAPICSFEFTRWFREPATILRPSSPRLPSQYFAPWTPGPEEENAILHDEPVNLEIEVQVGTFKHVRLVAVELRRRVSGAWEFPGIVLDTRRLCGPRPYLYEMRLPELSADYDAMRVAAYRESEAGEDELGDPLYSEEFHFTVTTAPAVLICIARGGVMPEDVGAGLFNLLFGDGASRADALSDLLETIVNVSVGGWEEEQICSNDERCTLTDEEPSYVDCEDDYEPFCQNGLTILSDRMLADGLIRMVEWYTEDGELYQRDGATRIRNRVALADFSCSETAMNWFQAWSYQDEIADFFRKGGRNVVLVGHSHGGAEMAHLLATEPLFDSGLKCPLFVALDATDEGGPVQELSDRAEKLLNFYQEANWWIDYQRGSHIDGVADDEQHDMSGYLKHVTFDRSTFIHERILAVLRDVITSLRDAARGG
jgi:hypothetical protein